MLRSDGGAARSQLAIRLARSLSPTSNAIFQRVAGTVVGITNRLLHRSPARALCQVSGGASCGVPNDALSALLRLAAMPAFAKVPGSGDSESESNTKSATKTKTTGTHGRPVRYPAPERIVAIGDVHGDYEALRKLLRRAGLVGKSGEWTGGRSVLVQVGDQLDRGDGERDIYNMLFRLQDTAAKDGGAVHILLGNHEMMNINLDFRYVTAGGFADFVHSRDGGVRAVTKPFRELIKALPPPMRPRATALAPGGKLARELAERAQVAIMVGDTVFVHAGLQPAHLGNDAERALGSLNSETRAFLRGERARLPEMLDGAGGPLWMRTYSRRDVRSGGQECQLLGQTLKLLGAKRMVVGHTVQPAINAACGGRVWRVDTGLSAAYGGPAEALEILRGGRTQVVTPRGTVDGKSRTF